MSYWWQLYDDALQDPEEEKEVGKGDRCTPELLLALIEKLGRVPTMVEAKAEFGGILGPLVDMWTLQKEGRWPR